MLITTAARGVGVGGISVGVGEAVEVGVGVGLLVMVAVGEGVVVEVAVGPTVGVINVGV